MWKYIIGDKRFENIRQNKRDIVLAWCKKEFGNLQLAHEAGCHVPEPIAYYRNVLVMEFIGDDVAAPLIKNAKVADPEAAFWGVAKDLRNLYASNLVHADISEFNIMYWNETPYIIDIGQGVVRTHPFAEEFLVRDVENLCRYFTKIGYKQEAGETLKYIRN